jgi:hypothetical protein
MLKTSLYQLLVLKVTAPMSCQLLGSKSGQKTKSAAMSRAFDVLMC